MSIRTSLGSNLFQHPGGMRCKDFIFARKHFEESKPVKQEKGDAAEESLTPVHRKAIHILRVFQNFYNPSQYGRTERILCEQTDEACTHAYSHTHFPPGWVIVACKFTSLPAFLSTTWTPAGPND